MAASGLLHGHFCKLLLGSAEEDMFTSFAVKYCKNRNCGSI